MSEFTWERPASREGFVWKEAGLAGPEFVAKDGATFEQYAPLRDGIALHRGLARTEPTPEGILAFANRYGRLGRVDFSGVSGADQHGEPLREWQRDILWLRGSLALWDMAHQKNSAGLAKLIKWQGEHVYHCPSDDRELREALDMWGRFELTIQAKPGDVVLVARLHVIGTINSWLAGSVSVQVDWNAKRSQALQVIVPRTLHGAIYLQLRARSCS